MAITRASCEVNSLEGFLDALRHPDEHKDAHVDQQDQFDQDMGGVFVRLNEQRDCAKDDNDKDGWILQKMRRG